MASTIRTMTLNLATLSVPVGLRTASERKLPTFSTASPKGNKYERFVGNADEAQDSLVDDLEHSVAVAAELGVAVEEVTPAKPQYRDTVTGETFDESEIVKGIWEKDTFYKIEQADLDAIEDATKQPDLTIQTFVPLADIPWERVKNGYFLVPDKGAGRKALNLIKLALEESGKAGVVLLMPKSRVHLGIVYAKHGGLMISTLAYAEEWAQVLDGQAAISADVSPEEMKMALALINAPALNSEASVLDSITDLQADAKLELVEKAKSGEPLGVETEEGVTVGAGEREETLLERSLRESLAIYKGTEKVPRAKKPARKASPDTSGKRRARPARAAR